jgi:hypothetical protein
VDEMDARSMMWWEGEEDIASRREKTKGNSINGSGTRSRVYVSRCDPSRKASSNAPIGTREFLSVPQMWRCFYGPREFDLSAPSGGRNNTLSNSNYPPDQPELTFVRVRSVTSKT